MPQALGGLVVRDGLGPRPPVGRLFHGPFFHHQNAVVVMQGVDRLGQLINLQPPWLLRMPGIQLVNKVFAVLNKRAGLPVSAAPVRPENSLPEYGHARMYVPGQNRPGLVE